MACVPKPPPDVIDPGFDENPPMAQPSRHAPQNSQTRLIGSDLEKQQPQPYSARPPPRTIQFVEKPRLVQPPVARQQQQQVQMSSHPYVQAGYGQPYRPTTPSGLSMHSNNSSIESYRQDQRVQHAPPRMASPTTTPSRRPWPPNTPYTEPIPRAMTPGSVYSNNSTLSSVVFASGSTPPPPLAAQINPIRPPLPKRSSSYTNSVYSIGSYYSRETMTAPPPVPSLGPGIAQATPGQQSMRSVTTPGSGSNEWKDLVMNAAGREDRQGAF